MPKVEILISTMDKGVAAVLERIRNAEGTLRFLVIQQTAEAAAGEYGAGSMRHLVFREKGLSRSRNRAIQHASGEYCLFADEDVDLLPGIGDTVAEAFENHPEADLITFQVATPGGGFFKDYAKGSRWHTRRTLGKVCSVEIAFRPDRLREKGVRFDESFGLGAPYATGEEFVFLNDCMDRGLRILYKPVPIVLHAPESSGARHDAAMCRYRGAMLARAYGPVFGAAAAALFAFRKYREYRGRMSLPGFLGAMLSGLVEYSRSGRKRRRPVTRTTS